MQCPNCKSPMHMSESRCPQCGADRPPRRFFSGEDRPFELTPEDPEFAFEDTPEIKPPEFGMEPRDLLGNKFREASRPLWPGLLTTPRPEIRWGGFWRRVVAFVVDLLVLSILASIMYGLCLIAYKVGLANHGRSVTWDNAIPLISMMTWATFALMTVYFVIFHGMDGKTIGKRMLRLRVTAADQSTITYKRAFARWLALVGFAPFLIGFLWILFNREKRGWHDLIARTWVIRE